MEVRELERAEKERIDQLCIAHYGRKALVIEHFYDIVTQNNPAIGGESVSLEVYPEYCFLGKCEFFIKKSDSFLVHKQSNVTTVEYTNTDMDWGYLPIDTLLFQQIALNNLSLQSSIIFSGYKIKFG